MLIPKKSHPQSQPAKQSGEKWCSDSAMCLHRTGPVKGDKLATWRVDTIGQAYSAHTPHHTRPTASLQMQAGVGGGV